MSSRADYRRRDRSWERDDRERGGGTRGNDGRRSGRGGSYRDEPRRRSSRSRSPRRDRDRDDRRGSDRRDSRDYRRDDDRRHDSGRYDRERERDRRPDERRRDDAPRDSRRDEHDVLNYEDSKSPYDRDPKSRISSKSAEPSSQADLLKNPSLASPHPNVDMVTLNSNENGEAMEEDNDEDDAMMTMMGVAGFGSTKGKHVAGNQEGGADIKKVRTWRQYMNRRGGFNRPLDKIK
ncbi:hypothetical protein BDN70DRAFT_881267 [Pholiota conissans]|uniref:U4/U6.U5 small nuclear ribonucleoprotein 27kDa protein domain-containing protein n=1 Tax=Pholiota conissans TaxID=109636 RepID=A0A9P5Z0D0_9AGAR|nr:hypothetical protein BDN70DRAFT_881267 [Pholiota conissans]